MASAPSILHVRLFSTRDKKGKIISNLFPRFFLPRLQINSLDIHAGRCYAVIGKSGAGKTVFNSFLMGWPSFTCGRGTHFEDIRWWDGAASFIVKTWQMSGICGTLTRLLAWHRLGKKGALFYLPQNLPDGRGYSMQTKTYIRHILCALRGQACIFTSGDDFDEAPPDILANLEKNIDALSGGERRRIELWARLRVLRDMPSERLGLLILDEPTTGLDVVQERKYLEMLREGLRSNPNVAALVTTHSLHLLDRDVRPEDRIFNGVIVVWKKVIKSSRWNKHQIECNVSPVFSPDISDLSMSWEDALDLFKSQGVSQWDGKLKVLEKEEI